MQYYIIAMSNYSSLVYYNYYKYNQHRGIQSLPLGGNRFTVGTPCCMTQPRPYLICCWKRNKRIRAHYQPLAGQI